MALRSACTRISFATRTSSSLFRSNGFSVGARCMSSFAGTEKPRKVTLIPGDGIGPECCDSVTGVFAAAGVPIEWERFDQLGYDPLDIQEVISSISRTGVALKGPLYTPHQARTPKSRNMQIRKALDLFANVVPVKYLKGIETRHSGDVDFVVIRENTEGEYTGIEHEISPGVVESLKIITTEAAARIANYAFEYAVKKDRKKVTVVHKANIQKLSDGEFLRVCRLTSKDYPSIQYEEMIVDNCTMQLAMKPQQFDVMVTPNLYGAIVTNIASALVGGPGLLAGANVGIRGQAIFESGARHVALSLSGKNQANPVGTLFASVMMLRHIGLDSYADRIERAVRLTIQQDKIYTADVGGNATTREVTHAVINNLSN